MSGGTHNNAVQPLGRLSPLTCPECGGSLSEQKDGALFRYRCHTGHVYDGRHLLTLQSESVEQALWSAVRAHDERATLLRRLAGQSRASNRLAAARRWEELLAEREEDANVIRRLLLNGRAGETESKTAVDDVGGDDSSGQPDQAAR